MVLDYKPSKYQEEIYHFIKKGNGNAVIKSCAGSGKTTTLVNSIKLLPKRKKCLFIAFNNSIVDELKLKLMNYSNCEVMTIHSLGFMMVRYNIDEDIALCEYKYVQYLKQNIRDLSEVEDGTIKDIETYIDRILSLVNFSRLNLAQSLKEIENIAKKYGITCSYDECNVALKCLKWGKKKTNEIDYTDMVWLPYELSMSPKGLTFDWVLFDECQDASLAAIELFKKCFKRGTRFVCVGDENQAINLFGGASLDALNILSNMPNTTVFNLPLSYRCPKNVIRFVNQYIKEIMADENAIDGFVLDNCHISDLKSGDMVLSRTNACLLIAYEKIINRNKACYIKGKEIGRGLLKLLNEFDVEELSKDLKEDGIFPRLYDKLFKERDRIMLSNNIEMADAIQTSEFLTLYDSIQALQVISKYCDNKFQLFDKIDTIFKEDEEGICLSTIHKSKGLEADNVYIINNSSIPPKRIVGGWEEIQEKNLRYVAYTRPRRVLGFISENEIRITRRKNDIESFIEELNGLENIISKLYSKTYGGENRIIELAKFRIKHSNTPEINNSNYVILNQQNDNVEENNTEDDIETFVNKYF